MSYPYWALLTPSWDPLSSISHVQAADPHPGLHVRRRPTCGLDKSFCKKCLEQLVLARNFVEKNCN